MPYVASSASVRQSPKFCSLAQKAAILDGMLRLRSPARINENSEVNPQSKQDEMLRMLVIEVAARKATP
jgi:hypothetical protein